MQRTLNPASDLDEARHAGRLDGESFATELWERDLQERQERLTRLAWGEEAEAPVPAAERPVASADILRLEHDMEALAAFHQAVLNSRAWRIAQTLRRLVGRAW